MAKEMPRFAVTYSYVFSSHMLRKDGSWSAPPPVYPPIVTNQSIMNLHDYIAMDSNDFPDLGKVYTLHEFLNRFKN